MNPLHISNRDRAIKELKTQKFDLFIIGGGITGAGIALDAASRGLKVGLVEMQDFSAGTSSRSTKLIHGGLRYLKNLELGLVMETGRERAVLHQNAPHLVHPEKMLLPIIKGGQLGRFSTNLALMVYDRLAGVQKKDKKKMLSKAKILELQPGLDQEKIIGGAIYSEYRTDDSRLTISTLKKAVELGAIVLNYMEAVDLVKKNDKVIGLQVKDAFTQEKFQIQAKMVINASGPWVDNFRIHDQSLDNKRLHLTKGIHLVVSNEKLKIMQACYMEIDDKRMIFAIPREDKVYIGTTDTDYVGEKSSPSTDKDDVAYLLKGINSIFPTAKIVSKDVLSHWAGLRPLITQKGKKNTEISRKDEIFISPSGLISIAGGKLTAYRKMAERTVDIACQQLGIKETSKTKDLPLSGAGKKETLEPEFSDFCCLFEQADYWRSHLWTRYGLDCVNVMENYYGMRKNTHREENLLKAEFKYCVENEACHGVFDFFLNRNALILFNPEVVEKHFQEILDYSQELLGLSSFSIEVEHKKMLNWLTKREEIRNG